MSVSGRRRADCLGSSHQHTPGKLNDRPLLEGSTAQPFELFIAIFLIMRFHLFLLVLFSKLKASTGCIHVYCHRVLLAFVCTSHPCQDFHCRRLADSLTTRDCDSHSLG
jgi:hypothetical protein